jgi:hypothetical protein
MPLLQQNFESNKNLEHLFGGYPIGNIFFGVTPSGVKYL